MQKKVIIYITLLTTVIVIILATKYLFKKEEKANIEPSKAPPTSDEVKITPISHATMILKFGGRTIYTDPVGDESAFSGKPAPDVIVVTDIHGDHFNENTLSSVSRDSTVIVMPQAVKNLLKQKVPGEIIVLNNGDSIQKQEIKIEAIPMYNIPESKDAFHTKGRGNGYVLESNGKRIYISGDTGPISEMKSLKNIDIAFIAMNLPYTMSIEEAADVVLSFKPKRVVPYHYREKDGFSDIDKFREIVKSKDQTILVDLLNFYP